GRVADRGEQLRRNRDRGEQQEDDQPDHRLAVRAHGGPQPAAAPADGGGRLGRRGGLDKQRGHGSYPFARDRGSSQAIAKSHTSTATSTATVKSMNRVCISG